jgi:hypothetical protein
MELSGRIVNPKVRQGFFAGAGEGCPFAALALKKKSNYPAKAKN